MTKGAGACIVVVLAIVPTRPLPAQHFALGPQIAFGDYKEVSADLHYRGTGIAGKGTLSWKKFSAVLVFSRLKYKPQREAAATEFDATEVDARLRYYIAGPVSAEAGFLSRKTDPEFEAQSVGGVVTGAQMAYLLGPGVRMALSGGLIFGSKFSGGGSISALGAFHLGLGVTIDALRGRMQVSGDYGFQRFSRKTDDGSRELPAPIQQSLGKVGIAVVF